MTDTDAAQIAEAYAQDAVDHAKTAFDVELDYSPESVERVESMLTELHAAIPRGFLARVLKRGPSNKDVETMAKMYGCYVGEVLRRASGGAWILDPETYLTLTKDDARVFPPIKVHKRLVNGAEDNVWVYFSVILREYWPAG